MGIRVKTLLGAIQKGKVSRCGNVTMVSDEDVEDFKDVDGNVWEFENIEEAKKFVLGHFIFREYEEPKKKGRKKK